MAENDAKTLYKAYWRVARRVGYSVAYPIGNDRERLIFWRAAISRAERSIPFSGWTNGKRYMDYDYLKMRRWNELGEIPF